jgi:cleavage and polyadenylation specificity factor subunit 1
MIREKSFGLQNIDMLLTSNLPLVLMVDASDFAIGATLHQIRDGIFQPLAFFSKKLSSAEKNYSTYDRELLSAYSVKHFQYMLERRDFPIYTDHKPLTFMFKQRSDKTSPRQIRHISFIGQFTTDIRYISGQENMVADACSRIVSISMQPTCTMEDTAAAQQGDEELSQLKQSSSLVFQTVALPNGLDLFCDASQKDLRPYIPLIGTDRQFSTPFTT